MHIRFQTLLAMAEERLDTEETPHVSNHLAGCKRCQHKFDEVKKLVESLTPSHKYPPPMHSLGRSSLCCDPEDLYQYSRDRLTKEKLESVWSHLITCDYCSRVVESFAEYQETPVAIKSARASETKIVERTYQFFSTHWRFAGAVLSAALVIVALWQFLLPSSFYEFSIIGQKEFNVRSFTTFTVSQGDTLYSGDQLQININLKKDLYLYIFLYSSSGEVRILFPSQNLNIKNPLPSGNQFQIPPGGFWPLDDVAGTETLFFAYSTTSEQGIETIPQELEQVTASVPKGLDQQKAAQKYLENRFESVRVFSFEHK